MSDAASSSKEAHPLEYPIDNVPVPGEPIEVGPGVYWVRMPLPFALNHINLWVLEDGDGWAVVDTGVDSPNVRSIWESLQSGFMGSKPLTRVIVTHMHPDHVGLAGWLTKAFDIDLYMPRTEYLMCRILVADTGRPAPREGIEFYRGAGFDEDQLETYRTRFGGFGRMVHDMPESYQRLTDGAALTIGGRAWYVLTGGGHSPEHASLYCPELKLLISGDQVLPTISSNVSVWPTEPNGDPLAEWLAACTKFKQVPDDVLVLPGHQKVFYGLHNRLDSLIAGHETGLSKLYDMLKEPRRAVDVFEALFKARITGDLVGMATGESVAHLNCLIGRGLAIKERNAAGVDWYRQL